jgi:hypothetical protein
MTATKKTKRERPVPKRPKYVLKVEVEGPGVHTKSIAIPDLVKICSAIQTAVHRQAEAMERPLAQTLRRGPITASAQEERTLELFGISAGSTGLLFRYAKPQQPLPLPEAREFGTDVLAKVAETVRAFERKKPQAHEVEAGVLESLRELSEILEKKTITRIKINVPRRNGKPRMIRAILNAAARERIAARVKLPTQGELTIEGKLEMADFKEAGKLCRIHPPIGLPLQCTFEPELEDQVYGALRRPARLTGTARLNPNTGKPEELKIEKIEILEELLLGANDFFTSRSLEQLAEAQGVHAVTNPNELAGGWPADENIDEFVDAIYESRG